MGKYLKKFDTTAQYNAATFDLPNVSLTMDDRQVHYNPYVEEEEELITVISTFMSLNSIEVILSQAIEDSQIANLGMQINGGSVIYPTSDGRSWIYSRTNYSILPLQVPSDTITIDGRQTSGNTVTVTYNNPS